MHVINAYQHTKDPVATAENQSPGNPKEKPKYSPTQVSDYLAYCSDLLTVVASMAGIYFQNVSETRVMQMCFQVQNLCALLSVKFWTKSGIIYENLGNSE